MIADYIVVGAGTAGAALAARLSEDPANHVLLIEAGGSDRHPLVRLPVGFIAATKRTDFNWGYVSEPESHLHGRTLPIPRGKLLGGSSSINGMFHIRGHPRDFDDWRDAGCTGWGYADVLPFFRRSEAHWRGESAFHGGSGPLTVRPIDPEHRLQDELRAAAVTAGHIANPDYDAETSEGVAAGTVAVDARGRRMSSARAYLRPARRRANLHVMTDAHATRIVFDGNRRAVGVEVHHYGRSRQLTAQREVIVAGGAYNSPHLLMLSGLGPAEELARHGITVVADMPGVGKNLIEHPRMPLAYRAASGATFADQLRADRVAMSMLRWAVLGRGPFASQITSGTVLLKSEPGLDRPDVQLLCNPVQLDARVWFPGVRPAKPPGFYVTVCQLYAKSRGAVTLRSADPFDAPRIAFNLFSASEDYPVMRRALRMARQIYQAEPLASLVAEETVPGPRIERDEDLDEAIRNLAGITHHPVGTCAMGTGPLAVVDPYLRVRGVGGLRVVDASIMPTIVGANTNAATIMIAEKVAHMIACA